MDIVRKFLGPKSKYENDLPYTYEARVEYIEGEKEYNSYVADTICGLVAHLDEKGFKSDEVGIYEIYKNQEKELDVNLCLSASGSWLNKAELCESFKDYYKGHIYKGGCTFEDRDGSCS